MRILIALLLLCLPASAFAGQRAVYRDEDGKRMTIEVADNGDAVVRNEDMPNNYGILKGGQFYLVSREKDEWNVARPEDLAVAFDQVLPPIFKTLFGAATAKHPNSKGFRVEAKGKRKILGHDGQVYAIYGFDDSKPDASKEVVVTKEAALQPVGNAMQEFMVSTTMMLAPLIGKTAAEIGGDIRTMFSYGTPLSIQGSLQLASFEKADIPASATELPAKPKSAEELLKEIKASSTTM
jgi:hypothetical protein